MGAAMFAATAAGIYENVEQAMNAMGHGFDAEYHPRGENTEHYNRRYHQYKKLGIFLEQQFAN
jgi:L-ribulokinase